jgi:hypothetical protein
MPGDYLVLMVDADPSVRRLVTLLLRDLSRGEPTG